MDKLHIYKSIFKYGVNSLPFIKFSDFTIIGVKQAFAMSFMWLSLGAFILVFTKNIWIKNYNTLKERIEKAITKSSKIDYIASMVFLLIFISVFSYFYYLLYIKTPWFSPEKERKFSAYYEKTYKRFEKIPVPKPVNSDFIVDIYPEKRALHTKVITEFANSSPFPIREQLLNIPSLVGNKIIELKITKPFSIVKKEVLAGGSVIWHIRFKTPLKSGERFKMVSDIYSKPASILQNSSHNVFPNGTFTNGVYPTFGYNMGLELFSRRLRKQYGLSPDNQIPKPSEKEATFNSNINGWTNFHAMVSTQKGQTVLAPGKLIRKWVKGNRAYFEFRTENPILHFYNFLSGRYSVVRERCCRIELEIYYHPEHHWNIKRIMRGLRASLKYHIEKLGPYPHSVLRIVEFPSFLGSFAQSFATNIAFSGGIGFLVREREGDIPVPVFVTAHETGHQWWAHQLISSSTKGETFLMESFAEYGAIRTMEILNGKNTIGKFLKYELDSYLKKRSSFINNEQPIIYSVSPAVYYNKGSLITYATSDLIGADSYESVQKNFIKRYGYKNNPYPTVTDYLNLLYPHISEKLLPIVKDWYEKVIVYKFKIDKVQVRKIGNNDYEYIVNYSAKKFITLKNGEEKDISFNEPIDIGILMGDKILIRKKVNIKRGKGRLLLRVPVKGNKIVIDPLYTRVNLLWKNAMKKID